MGNSLLKRSYCYYSRQHLSPAKVAKWSGKRKKKWHCLQLHYKGKGYAVDYIGLVVGYENNVNVIHHISHTKILNILMFSFRTKFKDCLKKVYKIINCVFAKVKCNLKSVCERFTQKSVHLHLSKHIWCCLVNASHALTRQPCIHGRSLTALI